MAMSAELAAALWRTAEDLADVAAARSLPLFRSPGLTAASKAASGLRPGHRGRPRGRAGDARAPRRAPARRTASSARSSRRPRARSGLTWVLDPIDGTRAFLSGATDLGHADRPRRRRRPGARRHRPALHRRAVHGRPRPRRDAARRRAPPARGPRLRRPRRRGALHHLSRRSAAPPSAPASRRCATGCG